MKSIKVTTQAELLIALGTKDALIELHGSGEFEIGGSSQVTACGSSQVTAYDSSQVTAYDSSQVRACGSSQVTAYDSSQVTAYGSSQVTACGSSQVTAYDSSQVTACGSSQVTAYGSSQVRACDSSQVTAYDSSQVTAYGSSQVTACGSSQVTAYDSSQVTACGSSQVTAYGSSQVRACGSSQVTASAYVAVTITGERVTVTGGVQIRIPVLANVLDWCAFHGLEVVDGIVTLYKAVRDTWESSHGFSYTPGTTPVAPDWDNGECECGGGLHFSPTPAHALAFDSQATKYLVCPVAVSDMRAPKPGDSYPQKIKAKGCAGPVRECDIGGNLTA